MRHDNRLLLVREVTTVAELDALPIGAVVLGKTLRTGGRNVFARNDTDQNQPGNWAALGLDDELTNLEVLKDSPLLYVEHTEYTL